MKTIRRILALLLALSVVLALGVGVFADGETPEAPETPEVTPSEPVTYSITIVPPANSGLMLEGNTYCAYRLFDATYSGVDNENVAYTVNKDFADFTYKPSNTTFEENQISYGGTNDNTLIDYLRTVESDSTALDTFAKAALAYIKEKSIEATASVKATAGDIKSNSTITVNAPGYYLVTGTATVANEQTVTAACSLTTAAPQTTITLKADAPTVSKKIVEGENRVDANTAAIGESVQYEIRSSVPNMTGYTGYWFVLEDTLSKGLTYNDDIKIEIIGEIGEEENNKKTLTKDTDYTVTTTPITEGENNDPAGTKIEIVLNSFIRYKNRTGDAIVVTYSATVNQDAELDPNTGNPNTVKLIYSNNPNVQYDGDKWTDDDETPKPSTGETPEAKVNTFVTGIKLTKTDSEGKKLTGAKFKIEGNSVKVVFINKEVYKENIDGTYYMLKDGTYTTETPTADTKANYDSIATKYEKVEEITKSNAAEAFVKEGYVDENGVLKFEGLGEGTYTIKELIAPNGYNLLKDPITIEITAEETVAGCTWTVNQVTKNEKNEEVKTPLNANTAHLYELTVVNNAGTELPSTGGMGTTLFYVIGGLLVVCAGVILVTRKRMSREG